MKNLIDMKIPSDFDFTSVSGLSNEVVEKLQKHEFITRDDWTNCFRLYNESRMKGALGKVTKG